MKRAYRERESDTGSGYERGGVDKRAFAVGRRDVADTLLDAGFDFGVLFQ